MNSLEITDLTKVYSRSFGSRPVVAIDGMNLTVPEGEAFGFVGPNGAGKSTTIRIITGVLPPTSGNVRLMGKAASDPNARRGVGYVPENPSLFDYLTPVEVLQMGLRLHQVRVGNEKAHCMHWLDRFELADVAHKPIRTFSKGMTQRVALAHALAIKPRMLILDEPLSGLDPIGRRDVVEILVEFKRKGGTLFFTSHVLHDVERLADRFGLIHRGRLQAVTAPADLVGGQDQVVVRSQGEYAVAGMQQDAPGRWYGTVARSDLWALLDALRAHGHTLIEVKPTLSLESAFLQVVGKSAADPVGWTSAAAAGDAMR